MTLVIYIYIYTYSYIYILIYIPYIFQGIQQVVQHADTLADSSTGEIIEIYSLH